MDIYYGYIVVYFIDGFCGCEVNILVVGILVWLFVDDDSLVVCYWFWLVLNLFVYYLWWYSCVYWDWILGVCF